MALTGLVNDAGPRPELAAYALNRPIRTQDAVITTAAHQLARKLKKPSSNPARERRLSDDELLALIEASSHTKNPHIVPIVLFALETGMRRGEILGLEWQNINFTKRIAFLPLTKNGTSREVPLSSKAATILEEQRINKYHVPFPITDNALRLAWDKLKKRAAISDLKFHDLRHEAISRFFEAGLSLVEVATISGHKDPKMLFRYTHLKAEEIAAKLQRLG